MADDDYQTFEAKVDRTTFVYSAVNTFQGNFQEAVKAWLRVEMGLAGVQWMRTRRAVGFKDPRHVSKVVLRCDWSTTGGDVDDSGI